MAWASLGSVAPVGLVGCGGEEASGVHAAKLPYGVRSEAVEHEACDESGRRVEIVDANGDGKPDIKRVYDKGTGKEICRITDLNHDGKPDLYEYYDANGTVRRREADYDDNGVVDSIDYYEGGKMVRREYDTTGQHRIDTWDYFDKDSGKRLRRERDTNNDGKVDQWWVWEGDKVTIATDKNGDGKPDPDTVIVLGGADGGIGPAPPPPSAPPAPSASSASASSPVPTQPADNSALDAGVGASDAGSAPKRKGP
jgi:antitoxin component YwqK of YwqJK toxin-antitoxin module